MTESVSTEQVAMHSYEIMVIVRPGLGEQKTLEVLGEVKGLISNNGGKVTAEDLWGTRDLAYIIKKHDQGYYAVLNFQLEPTKLQSLNKPLNLNQEVLRYLITRTPEGYTFVTLEEYGAAAVKEEEDSKKEKEDSAKKKVVKQSVEKAQVVEQKVEKKETKEKTAEVDDKLKNIINDPDISL
ncbi:MAG: 30S ribosomal protein S6 [Lutibacter sp.]|nr:30S ribosomal protein S6 [Lutibacter sp.]